MKKRDYYEVLSVPKTASGDDIKNAYRKLAMKYHPDTNHDKGAILRFKEVQEAYDCLSDPDKRHVYDAYGHSGKTPAVVLESKTGRYVISDTPLLLGEISNIYRCACITLNDKKPLPPDGIFKIVRSAKDNDLAEHELTMLKALGNMLSDVGSKYVPKVLDSFPTASGRNRRLAIVFPYSKSYHSIDDILAAYPQGVLQEDAAWMINRILEGLWFFRDAGFVHGALLPHNIILDTDAHGILFQEWSFGTNKPGEMIKAKSKRYESWYPPEVDAKLAATPALDTFMAAKCIVRLLGGDPITNSLPKKVHPKIGRFLNAMLIPAPHRRTASESLRMESKEIFRELFGKPTFRKFAMPA